MCKSCRARQELSNEYLLAKIGFDTAENEPFNFHNFSSLQGFHFNRAVVSFERRCEGEELSMPSFARPRSGTEMPSGRYARPDPLGHDAGEERRKGMHDREQLRGPPAEQLCGEMRRAGSSAIAGTTEYYVHIALLFSMARLFELAPIFR